MSIVNDEPAVDLQSQITDIKNEIEDIKKILNGMAQWPDPWITLKRGCRMKGVSWETVRRYPWRQPNGGEPDAIINNRPYWRPETIREWILLGDGELARRYRKQ
jgi:hypothetical protein